MNNPVRSARMVDIRWSSAALLGVLAVSATLQAVRPVSTASVLLAFLMVVLAGAWYGGLQAGLITTAASLLIACYWFIPPIHSFNVGTPRDMVFLSLAGAQGLCISWLCEQRRRARASHKEIAVELDQARQELEHKRRSLEELEVDLDRLRIALPQRIGFAIQTSRQAREFLAARHGSDRNGTGEVLSGLAQAEQRVAAFAVAVEQYTRSDRKQSSEFVSSLLLLDQVIEAMRPEIARADAHIVMPETLPSVCVRKADLYRVFNELLTNAVRFRAARPLRLEIACREENRQFVFTIADNGVGMVPIHAAEAFNLFGPSHAGDPDRLCVGLALTRRIVRSYGGDIWLRSSPGIGTTVAFSLPIVQR